MQLTLSPSDFIDGDSALRKLAAAVNGGVFNPAVTPTAGGNQSTAAQLNYGLTAVIPPENNYDTVQLPAAVAGSYCKLIAVGTNGGGTGNAIAVWAKYGTDDSINGVANASDYVDFGASYPHEGDFFCFDDGLWLTQLTAD